MTIIDTEAVVRPTPRRRVGPPLYTKATIAAPNDATVTPTWELAPELERLLAKLDRESDSTDSAGNTGSRFALCRRAATINCHSEERYLRRLYGILHHDSRATDFRYADTFFLAADENVSRDSNLPVLPAGKAAALEMVDVYQEIILEGAETLTPSQRSRLAQTLLHFSQGYIHEFNVIEMKAAAALESFFSGALAAGSEDE